MHGCSFELPAINPAYARSRWVGLAAHSQLGSCTLAAGLCEVFIEAVHQAIGSALDILSGAWQGRMRRACSL